MQTVGDIKASIRAHGYESDTDSQQLILINKGQREVIGDHRWRFMLQSSTVALVIGQTTYALPTSPALHHIESIRVTTASAIDPYLEMEWVDSEEFLAYVAANSYAGAWTGFMPTIWTDPDTTNFQIFPAAQYAGTFTVRYTRKAADLTSDSSVPDIPSEDLDILVDYVCARLAKRERQYDAASDFQADFDRALARMKGQHGLRQRQNSTRVASRRDGPAHTGAWWR